ncbi:MAG: N-acetylmuramic acid 6-phosphate etherase [Bacteroidetes bacterium]|nr:N-acetylmuramic acid 6-phosphate etherase [Bacteroidota bacterium]
MDKKTQDQLILQLGRLATETTSEEWPDWCLESNESILQYQLADYHRMVTSLEPVIPLLSRLIDRAVSILGNGGSVIYAGAGTSGRLGVLDSSECPPTFGVPPTMVRGVIAGGDRALRSSVEGAEDNREQARVDYQSSSIRPEDLVIGITASSRTPWVLEFLMAHKEVGGMTGLLVCNTTELSAYSYVDHLLPLQAGNEMITGSTRLKSGTLTKMVLNLFSSITFIRLGKTYKNRMVDLVAVNEKLKARAVKTMMELTALPADECRTYLERSDFQLKTALVCHQRKVIPTVARELIEKDPLVLYHS